jgi:hypothetical protein
VGISRVQGIEVGIKRFNAYILRIDAHIVQHPALGREQAQDRVGQRRGVEIDHPAFVQPQPGDLVRLAALDFDAVGIVVFAIVVVCHRRPLLVGGPAAPGSFET